MTKDSSIFCGVPCQWFDLYLPSFTIYLLKKNITHTNDWIISNQPYRIMQAIEISTHTHTHTQKRLLYQEKDKHITTLMNLLNPQILCTWGRYQFSYKAFASIKLSRHSMRFLWFVLVFIMEACIWHDYKPLDGRSILLYACYIKPILLFKAKNSESNSNLCF